jgi:hypothetical protein
VAARVELGPNMAAPCRALFMTALREDESRKEKREKKRREGKKKKRKKWENFQTWKFSEKKITYKVGQKIFLLKKDICLIINK